MGNDRRKHAADQSASRCINYSSAGATCAPEDVLRVQVYVHPVDEQGRVPGLQAQGRLEKLQRERDREKEREIHTYIHTC